MSVPNPLSDNSTSKVSIFEFAQEELSGYYVDVLLPLPIAELFTYSIPKELVNQIEFGKRVGVQFGKKRILCGFAINIHTNRPENYASKPVLDVFDSKPVLTKLRYQFWKWISDYYMTDIGSVCDLSTPAALKLKSETFISLKDESIEMEGSSVYEFSTPEIEILTILKSNGTMLMEKLSQLRSDKKFYSHIKSLYEKDLILVTEKVSEVIRPKWRSYIFPNFEINDKEEVNQLLESLKKSPKQADTVLAFYNLYQRNNQVVEKSELIKFAQVSASILKPLISKGILIEETFAAERIPQFEKKDTVILDQESQDKLDSDLEQLNQFWVKNTVTNLFSPNEYSKINFLIEVCKQKITEGQILILVPEVLLGNQLIKDLGVYFGKECGIYHPKHNIQEKFEIWEKVRNNKLKLIVSTKIGVLLPFDHLKLVIIEDEHDSIYKQFEGAIKYHARDCAIYLSHLSGAKVLLTSNCPSFETLLNIENNKYNQLTLQDLRKENQSDFIDVQVVDMKAEAKVKSLIGMFSSSLFERVSNSNKTQNKVLLYQNRRGYAPILECGNCNWIPQCKQCDISLTYYQLYKALICHYCGSKVDFPKICPACGSINLRLLGIGTEKVEEDIGIYAPNLKVLRLDQDVLKGKKNSHTDVLENLKEGKFDVVIGTQMIVRGIRISGIGTIGLLSADQLINIPDFRAGERAFQTFNQLQRRLVDSHLKDKKIYLQSWNPENKFFKNLLESDYIGYYETTKMERQLFQYPPYTRLIKIVFKGLNQTLTMDMAKEVVSAIQSLGFLKTLGPEYPPVSRVRGLYLVHLLIKCNRADKLIMEKKSELKRIIKEINSAKIYIKIKTSIDVDPN